MDRFDTDTLRFSSDNRFSVMTFNIRFGLADDGSNGWKHRKKILPKLFRDYPVDFIGFQEVNAFQADDLHSMLKDYRSIGKRAPAPPFWQNNIIFYREDWHLTDYTHFFLSPTPEIPSRSRRSRWPRQCTIGSFRKQSYRLTCINTHFDFHPSVQSFSAKLIMKRLMQRMDPVPAVLMGDFNASFDSPHYRIFVNETGTCNRPGLSFHNAFSEKTCGTYHGFSGKPGNDCIDWILHTGGITPEDARVVIDHVNGAYYSDHFPVIATFKFSGTDCLKKSKE